MQAFQMDIDGEEICLTLSTFLGNIAGILASKQSSSLALCKIMGACIYVTEEIE